MDLGLPSGTLWASCNLGADSPEESGNLISWGTAVDEDGYTIAYDVPKDVKDISGTKYDAAATAWGGNWKMPTKKDWKELINNCTWTEVNNNGVKGQKVKGKNGNHIFLPRIEKYNKYYGNTYYACQYWSATGEKDKYGYYHVFIYDGDDSKDSFALDYDDRKLPIRPVQKR